MDYCKTKMQVAHSPSYLSPSLPQGCVATIGTYDGIHLGHQQVLKRLKNQAKALKLPAVVILFEPQPLEFFLGNRSNSRLTTIREKLRLLKALKIDKVLCLRFNTKLANLHAKQFIEEILIAQLGVKYLVMGDNFAFGRNCSGGYELLQQYPLFQTEQLPGLQLDGIRVSSTIIRQALAVADFTVAAKFLGRPYSISGHVTHGNRMGHILGYPTANIFLSHRILPLSGVFASTVYIGRKSFLGVTNIGTRPTVDGSRNVLETHILDFNREVYGKKITVEFIKRLRDEVKFSSIDKLKQQIQTDIDSCKNIT